MVRSDARSTHEVESSHASRRRVTGRSHRKSSASPTVFQLSCGAIGLLAFAQLLFASLAFIHRFEAAREVRVEEKVVTKVVEVAAPQSDKDEVHAPPVVALPPAPEPVAPQTDLPPARPVDAPEIADPVVERLIKEARKARISDDMGTAIIKLEEAHATDPQDPSALYELGLVYEGMAAYDTSLAEKAAEAFQQVYNMGVSTAGSLYQLAARKLSEGISRPGDMRGKLALGRVRVFQDDDHPEGQRVIFTIPVLATPEDGPGASEFVVSVLPFDKTPDGRVHTYGADAKITNEWISGAIDWAGGEESLRTTYLIPKGHRGESYLLGTRKYYGYLVQLFYKNELIDVAAYPHHLTSEISAPSGNYYLNSGTDHGFFDDDMLLPNYDPAQPLLPDLDGSNFSDSLPLPTE